MSVLLYMDHHVPSAITAGLRLRGIDVLTAYEDASHELEDPALLDRAGSLGRALFTFDGDLLIETARRQSNRIYFAGLIYAHELNITIGTCINDLQLLCEVLELEEIENRVYRLPL